MRSALPLALVTLGAGLAGTSLSHAAAPSPGERAYQKCYSCHSLKGPDPTTQGPSLKGIVGRKVASEEGFEYSRYMLEFAEKHERWDRETLDAFIADPQAVVPKTEMGFFGISGPAERTALIDYLEASSN